MVHKQRKVNNISKTSSKLLTAMHRSFLNTSVAHNYDVRMSNLCFYLSVNNSYNNMALCQTAGVLSLPFIK